MIEIGVIIVLCWLLDYAKLAWHGMHSMSVGYMIVHFLSAWGVLFLSSDINVFLSMSIAATLVGAHILTIGAKRRGTLVGKSLSWLSSWPFQLFALGSMGWHVFYAGPLVGAGNLMMWMDVIRVWTCNERFRLRPKHWTESFWERFMM
jgi:hypothetical protein